LGVKSQQSTFREGIQNPGARIIPSSRIGELQLLFPIPVLVVVIVIVVELSVLGPNFDHDRDDQGFAPIVPCNYSMPWNNCNVCGAACLSGIDSALSARSNRRRPSDRSPLDPRRLSGQPWSGNSTKRLIRSPKVYVRDSVHYGCAELQPTRKVVIYPGENSFSLGEGIEAMGLSG
jgi:hypothetical protein